MRTHVEFDVSGETLPAMKATAYNQLAKFLNINREEVEEQAEVELRVDGETEHVGSAANPDMINVTRYTGHVYAKVRGQ